MFIHILILTTITVAFGLAYGEERIEYNGQLYRPSEIENATNICSRMWEHLDKYDVPNIYNTIFKDCMEKQLKGLLLWERWIEKNGLQNDDNNDTYKKIEKLCLVRNYEIYDEVPVFNFLEVYKCANKQEKAVKEIIDRKNQDIYKSLYRISDQINKRIEMGFYDNPPRDYEPLHVETVGKFFLCSEEWSGDYVMWNKCEHDWLKKLSQD